MPEANTPLGPAVLPFGLVLARRLPLPRKLGLLERIYGRQLARMGVQWLRAWNGRIWKLDLSEASHRWIAYGVYEGPDWLDWLTGRLAKRPGLAIESGANIGQTLMYYAHMTGVRVLAFEPNPVDADWLQNCLDANPALAVTVVRCGLAAASGDLELQLAGGRSTMNMEWYKGKAFARSLVKVVRLDDFLAERDIERVAFWKLDVEGFELEALQGARKYLAMGKIDALMVEAVGSGYVPIKELLESHGYSLHLIGRGGSLTPAPPQAPRKYQNVVALSRNSD